MAGMGRKQLSDPPVSPRQNEKARRTGHDGPSWSGTSKVEFERAILSLVRSSCSTVKAQRGLLTKSSTAVSDQATQCWSCTSLIDLRHCGAFGGAFAPGRICQSIVSGRRRRVCDPRAMPARRCAARIEWHHYSAAWARRSVLQSQRLPNLIKLERVRPPQVPLARP